MASLLLTATHHGEDRLHKATAGVTLGAVTAFAPEHGVPQSPCRTILCRLDPLAPHEGPQRPLPGQQLQTGRRRLGTPALTASPQFVAKRARQPAHIPLNGGSRPHAL